MTREKDIEIKFQTPYLELVVWTITLLSAIISIYKLTQPYPENIWIFTATTFTLMTIQMTRIINSRFKRLTFKNDNILIKDFFKPWTSKFSRQEVKGYVLLESFQGIGTTFIIQLQTKDNKKVNILKEGYKNYDKVKDSFDQSGISYLGRIKLNDKRVRLYKWIMTWGLYIIPAIIIIIYQLTRDN